MSSDNPGPRAAKQLGWPIYVLGLIAIICYADLAAGAFAGEKIDSSGLPVTVFWTGVLVAYVYRRKKRNGWLGFVVGLAVGMGAVVATIFIFSVLKRIV